MPWFLKNKKMPLRVLWFPRELHDELVPHRAMILTTKVRVLSSGVYCYSSFVLFCFVLRIVYLLRFWRSSTSWRRSLERMVAKLSSSSTWKNIDFYQQRSRCCRKQRLVLHTLYRGISETYICTTTWNNIDLSAEKSILPKTASSATYRRGISKTYMSTTTYDMSWAE